MAEQSKDGGGFPFGGIAALLLVAVGLIAQQYPLEPTRPPSSHIAREHYPSLQQVPARQWEDPFEAIGPDSAERVSAGSGAQGDRPRARAASLAEMHRRIDELAGKPASPCVSVMPVLVPGGPFGEYAEARRRTRYAVVTGLLQSDYAPEDEDHLGYVRLHNPDDASTAEFPRAVPFEWFAATPSRDRADPNGRCVRRARVLVLWLDEAAFSTAPLAQLQAVLQQFDPNGGRIDRVRVIGPGSSSTLAAMRAEVAPLPRLVPNRACSDAASVPYAQRPQGSRARDPVWSYCAPLELYVWAATTPQRLLTTDAVDRTLGEGFAVRGITLVTPVIDDEKVLERLDAELLLRNVRIGHDAIALVAESETLYGRALQELIREKAQGVAAARQQRGDALIAFNYLRGLDGETAGRAGQTQRAERPKDQKRGAPDTETSSGFAQLDYAKRIARAVRIEHDRLRGEGSKIAAVGVLGTDFYDKSLLLQALKKELPHAVYFTTDLDARMTDANQTRASRNLLVVSGLGLSLHPQWQRGAAPFRDGYQTGAYLATLLALNVRIRHAEYRRRIDRDGTASVNDVSAFLNEQMRPRAFEIGRHEIFDFGAVTQKPGAAPGASRGCTANDVLACKPLLPPASEYVQLAGARNIALAVAIVIAGLGLLVCTSWFLRNTIYRARALPDWPLLSFAVLIFVLLVCWAFVLIWYSGIEREPFRWAEGLSAWPTLLLRLLALAVMAFFVAGLVADHEHMQAVLKDFCLPERSPERRRAWRSLLGSLPRGWLRGPAVPDPGQTRRRNDSWRHRFWRTFAYATFTDPRSSLAGWVEKDDAGPGAQSNGLPCADTGRVNALEVIRQYLELARFKRRCDRIVPTFAFYILFAFALTFLWDMPNAPIRGADTARFHFVLLAAYVICYGLLLFAIVDAVRLFEALLHKLTHAETEYGQATLDAFAERLGLRRTPEVDRYLSDWIDIEFVARQTESTVKLVYFPFVILAIGLIARSQIFDNWYTPLSLSIIFVLGAGYAAFATIRLRTSAERARRHAIDSMSVQLLGLRGAATLPENEIRQLDALLAQVRTNQRGALMPLQQQPLWKAVILPLSGFGGIEVLQYFWLMQG